MKGVAVVFVSQFENGWRSDMDVMLIAIWDGKKAEIYTDISMSSKSLGHNVLDLEDFNWDDHGELVGHNLHGEYREKSFDILKAVKEASAPVLQNEGKRFQLYDLARWNHVRSRPVEFVSRLRRSMAWMRGQHIKVARWAIEDARVCYDLRRKVDKEGMVRFLDVKTGKKAYADVSWRITEEE